MFTDQSVLEIFCELPGHRGCAETDLEAIESKLGIRFPTYYRQLMLLDAQRLINTGMILPLDEIQTHARVELGPVGGESSVFALPQVVFAFDDIRAVFAIDCMGLDDSPVYEFDHCNADEGSRPIRVHDTLQPFFADILRGYLRLR